MLECATVIIGWIVVITSDEKDPIVIIIHTFGVLLDDIFIIASVFKTKSTVSGNYEKRILHTVLYAHFVHKKIEISVNIPRNDYGFTFWKFIYFIVCIIHAVCFPNMDEVFSE